MHMDERSVDCLVLGHHDQDRKVSAKSVTMGAMTLCKNFKWLQRIALNFLLLDGEIPCSPFMVYIFRSIFVLRSMTSTTIIVFDS